MTNKNSTMYKKSPGFTLIEVLLAIAVVTLLGGIAAPIYQSFENHDSLDVATNTLVENFRRAQALSKSADGDSSWGVTLLTGKITLFKGSSYALRDPEYDEVFDISSSLYVSSGPQEIVYSKFYGIPNPYGTIILNNINNESRTITINSIGMVDY